MKLPKNLPINTKYLNEYMQNHNLNNRELANKIGMHESSISRILKSEKGVGIKFIVGTIKNLHDLEIERLLNIEKE
ncbi:hypothetical protein [Cytobacillus horneckiae]|uniref:XRE family transcriptional regulator n=1 Tax=Cytobacillus horneckiae TaxID=549687 RepID=A0A2N0ZAZ4_9BACI|nr:hypothetical protein [Cytobacillus horneckiae]MEC1158714.1 hypothetical protein [Cytobacillus horneckiae]NRG48401.1 hypothetical protein [Bacillus sp. CRN 9]PKG26676.1 hypothetical protein CWS20_22780 [Cytobacillus horneckiae]